MISIYVDLANINISSNRKAFLKWINHINQNYFNYVKFRARHFTLLVCSLQINLHTKISHIRQLIRLVINIALKKTCNNVALKRVDASYCYAVVSCTMELSPHFNIHSSCSPSICTKSWGAWSMNALRNLIFNLFYFIFTSDITLIRW